MVAEIQLPLKGEVEGIGRRGGCSADGKLFHPPDVCVCVKAFRMRSFVHTFNNANNGG